IVDKPMCRCALIFCLFFEAEDGIRDKLVTGVQTCALPISTATADNTMAGVDGTSAPRRSHQLAANSATTTTFPPPCHAPIIFARSEERRVGKECGAGVGADGAAHVEAN